MGDGVGDGVGEGEGEQGLDGADKKRLMLMQAEPENWR